MLLSLFERIFFLGLLLGTLQIPVVCDHYVQYLSAIADTRKRDVGDFERNAMQSEKSLDAMIDSFSKNSDPAVRRDAEKKRQTVEEYRIAILQVEKLRDGGYFRRAFIVLANPQILSRVLQNYKPGIPVSTSDLLYSALLAFLLSLGISVLLKRVFRKAYP